jgi:DNA-binding NarL/FixJ family response regulator
MISVLVADDHEFVREGVVAALSAAGDIKIVGSCGNGREAVEQAKICRPDVILMDLSMPVLGGVEATRELLADRPDARVVIFTAAFDGRDVTAARAAGAVDCVFKTAQISDVIGSIRRAAASPRLGPYAPR